MKYLTLFTDAPAENGKSTLLYKDISDFKKHEDATITFKTQKGVEIETCLRWRINTGTKEQLEALNGGHEAEGAPPPAPRAGNRARW